MKYRFHHRRSIRLRGYDYSQPGAYFITICTYRREMLLQTATVQELVQWAWLDIPRRFDSVALDEFVIMPNHVHGIVVMEADADADQGAPRRAPTRRPTLGAIVLAFKSVSAIAANVVLGRVGAPFWQRNYYEHIVRDEDELDAIRQYIRNNPLKWDEDPDNPNRP